MKPNYLRLLHTRVTSSKYYEKRKFFNLDEACIFLYHLMRYTCIRFIKIELFIATLNSYIYKTNVHFSKNWNKGRVRRLVFIDA